MRYFLLGDIPLFLKPFVSLTSDSTLDKALTAPCFEMPNRELRAYLSRMLEEMTRQTEEFLEYDGKMYSGPDGDGRTSRAN